MNLPVYLEMYGGLGMFAAFVWLAIAEWRQERRRGPRTPRVEQCSHDWVLPCDGLAPEDNLRCALTLQHLGKHSCMGPFRNDPRPYCFMCKNRKGERC